MNDKYWDEYKMQSPAVKAYEKEQIAEALQVSITNLALAFSFCKLYRNAYYHKGVVTIARDATIYRVGRKSRTKKLRGV